MAALTLLNTVEIVCPKVLRMVTAATATSAAINAYSIIVTPLVSPTREFKVALAEAPKFIAMLRSWAMTAYMMTL